MDSFFLTPRQVLYALLALVFAASPAGDAGQNSGLTVQGFIAANFSLKIISPNQLPGQTSNLDPNQGIEVARIVEFNNAPGVFTLLISSQNAGKLKASSPVPDPRAPSAATEPIGYELSHNSDQINIKSGEARLSFGFRAGGTTSVSVIRIHFSTSSSPTNEQVARSVYSDTLIFSVAAM